MSSKGFIKFRKNAPDSEERFGKRDKRRTPRHRVTKRETWYTKAIDKDNKEQDA